MKHKDKPSSPTSLLQIGVFLESGREGPTCLAKVTVGAIVIVYPTRLVFAYFIQFMIDYQSSNGAFRAVCRTNPIFPQLFESLGKKIINVEAALAPSAEYI